MATGLSFLEEEMAGLATRLETMERDWQDQKRSGNRTAGGLIVPKGASTTDPRMAAVASEVASLSSKLDDVLAVLQSVQRVQRQQQNAIEEMAILGTYTPSDVAA